MMLGMRPATREQESPVPTPHAAGTYRTARYGQLGNAAVFWLPGERKVVLTGTRQFQRRWVKETN